MIQLEKFKKKKQERDREKARERRRRRNRKYGQAKLKHARRGVTSCVMAALAGSLLILLLGIAYASAGTSASFIGGMGMIALTFTMIGLYMAVKGFKERNKDYLTCKIGLGCNLVFVLGYIAIFLRGLF